MYAFVAKSEPGERVLDFIRNMPGTSEEQTKSRQSLKISDNGKATVCTKDGKTFEFFVGEPLDSFNNPSPTVVALVSFEGKNSFRIHHGEDGPYIPLRRKLNVRQIANTLIKMAGPDMSDNGKGVHFITVEGEVVSPEIHELSDFVETASFLYRGIHTGADCDKTDRLLHFVNVPLYGHELQYKSCGGVYPANIACGVEIVPSSAARVRWAGRLNIARDGLPVFSDLTGADALSFHIRASVLIAEEMGTVFEPMSGFLYKNCRFKEAVACVLSACPKRFYRMYDKDGYEHSFASADEKNLYFSGKVNMHKGKERFYPPTRCGNGLLCFEKARVAESFLNFCELTLEVAAGKTVSWPKEIFVPDTHFALTLMQLEAAQRGFPDIFTMSGLVMRDYLIYGKMPGNTGVPVMHTKRNTELFNLLSELYCPHKKENVRMVLFPQLETDAVDKKWNIGQNDDHYQIFHRIKNGEIDLEEFRKDILALKFKN